MADKVPCANSKTVEELLRCITKSYGVPLPTRRDIGNDPLLVTFYNMPVEVGERKPYDLFADVNPGEPSRWPEFPIVNLETLAVYVKKPAKT
jgi:hypothetical protein